MSILHHLALRIRVCWSLTTSNLGIHTGLETTSLEPAIPTLQTLQDFW